MGIKGYVPNRRNFSFSAFRTPTFKIGALTRYPNTDREWNPDKNTFTFTEEQSSSLSEQAWDSYQVENLTVSDENCVQLFFSRKNIFRRPTAKHKTLMQPASCWSLARITATTSTASRTGPRSPQTATVTGGGLTLRLKTSRSRRVTVRRFGAC